MNPDFTIDYVLPPLVCCFAGTEPVWQNETKRCLDRLSHDPIVGTESAVEVRWQSCRVDEVHDQELPAGSLLALFVRADQLESAIPQIHGLWRRNIVVVAIGDPALRQSTLPLITAGTVTLVTDIFGCQRLAAIIQRMRDRRRPVMTDWRSRFVNRLPWKPVEWKHDGHKNNNLKQQSKPSD